MTSAGHIIVLLRSDVAGQRSRETSEEPEPVVALRANGFDVRPLHPAADDLEARRSFFVSADGLLDPMETARLIAEVDGVEAAYFTPPGEAPAP